MSVLGSEVNEGKLDFLKVVRGMVGGALDHERMGR